MKGYEGFPDILLTRRLPILLRVDGRAFHTYTKAFDKPFDPRIHEAMEKATADLLHGVATQHPSFSLDPSFIQGLLAQPPTEDKTPGPK